MTIHHIPRQKWLKLEKSRGEKYEEEYIDEVISRLDPASDEADEKGMITTIVTVEKREQLSASELMPI